MTSVNDNPNRAPVGRPPVSQTKPEHFGVVATCEACEEPLDAAKGDSLSRCAACSTKVYQVMFDGDEWYVEATSFGEAVDLWRRRVAKAWGDHYHESDEPSSVTFLGDGPVLRASRQEGQEKDDRELRSVFEIAVESVEQLGYHALFALRALPDFIKAGEAAMRGDGNARFAAETAIIIARGGSPSEVRP